MAPKKKSESNWEEAEQVGPYQLHEPIPDTANEQGELFRATNSTSGTTALVLKRATSPGAEPLRDWQARCTSSSAHNCLAMEVESSPWCFSKDTQSAEELVFAFEDVRDAIRLMAQHLSGPGEPMPQRRSMRTWVGAAVACALVLVCLQIARHSTTSEPHAHGEAISEQAVHVDTDPPSMGNSLMGAVDGGPTFLSLPFPRQPYKGQKRPPCNPRVETEIMGACWVPHALKAPCPEELYEYQGQCFTTSMLPPAAPQSLGK